MPKNQISVEELRVRVMKLKHELGWEPHNEKELAQRYLGYVLDIIDEYRYRQVRSDRLYWFLGRINTHS